MTKKAKVRRKSPLFEEVPSPLRSQHHAHDLACASRFPRIRGFTVYVQRVVDGSFSIFHYFPIKAFGKSQKCHQSSVF